MKIAIVDDDTHCLYDITLRLHEFESHREDIHFEIQTYSSSSGFLDNYHSQYFDLVYLNVNIDDSKGIELAQIIRKRQSNCMIILIADHIEFVHESFAVQAFQYLQKPFDDELFKSELQRAVHQYRYHKKAFILHTEKGKTVFHLKDIVYIETSYSTYKICTIKDFYYGQYKQAIKIKEEMLNYSFFKISRSLIVNLDYVKQFDYLSVIMSNGDILPIPRKRFKDFKRMFYEHVTK